MLNNRFNNMMNGITLRTVSMAAVLMLAAACQSKQPENHGEVFAPDDQPTAMDHLLDAQAARGARADATLYAVHFDGPNLNPLGMYKLDLMLKDDSALPLSVWMDVPDDDSAQSRRMSVATYLKDRGIAPERVTFGHGPNPDVAHSAAQGLADLPKTDTDSGSGTAAATGAASASASAAPAGGSH